jgi:hypothetical protein
MEGRSFQGAGFARGASRIRVYLLPRSGFALALLANLIWGTSFLASKVTLLVWGPFTASALRFAAAIAGMLLVLPALGLPIQVPRSRGAWWRVLLVGVSGFGLLYPLQLAGLNAIPSSLSAAIMLTSPLFVLMFTAGFFTRDAFSAKAVCDRPGHRRRRDPRQSEHFRGLVVVADYAPKTHGRIRTHPGRVVEPGAFGGGDPLGRPRSRFTEPDFLVDVRG